MLEKLTKLKEVFSLLSQQETFDNVKENIAANIPFKGTNLWILIFAIFIACLGLNMNSTAVIIGAMLISPLMGPIMGVGFSVGINDPWMLKTAIKNYAFASGVGLVTSTIYFLVSPISDAYSEILARTSPNIYDVLIAFFGGLAGIVATYSKLKGNVIPGVAIATALMPPLCTAGYGLATLQFSYFFGALYLYLINTVYIALATFIVLKVVDFPRYHFKDERIEKRSRKIMWFLVVLTLIPSIYFGYVMVNKNEFERNASRFISGEAVFQNNFLLSKKISYESDEIELTYGGEKLSEESMKALKKKANNYGLEGVKLVIKQGFNFVPSANGQNNIVPANDSEQQLKKFLVMRSDSINAHKKETEQIFKELKVQNNNIKKFAFSTMDEVTDSSIIKKNVMLISAKAPIREVEKTKINEWLKVRVNNPKVEIIYNIQ
ncbi:TIGR00341 family protein [Riemerella anatipestifer]|uniref:TIGR00341 family protein n=1 Tax=Riemerella anatipestifer TaxID=34085 RepID=UPI000D14470C|nr:TIGR00341 family protein [Riemerella anatipestifer]MBO4233282.1 TIGR00341 family protein [Riemerella anatipestifer]MBT0550218.1 TIGR00341 family protein [Riemerella anatipestifer]MBT0556934.1 TIGR00341 family protein [Riemerella anatipestifer]MBT0560978.1 TIGR00341 family protein [Riemerella anatipestifer]MDD1524406.1 TIGR00341 family protein [Riemerella anatipestifer]